MPTSQELYHKDFYIWAMTTAQCLRQQQWQQIDWEAVIEDSPSLQHEVDVLLSKRYRKARERALDQTGLSETALPRTCPWSGAQILADDFWPETW